MEETISKHNLKKPAASSFGSEGSFLSWVVEYMKPDERNVKNLGEDQLVLTLVAVHTTCKSLRIIVESRVSEILD